MINSTLLFLIGVSVFLIIYVVFHFLVYKKGIVNYKIYLINLDRRPDRLETTTNLLKEKGYTDIIRFQAVDGSKLTDEQLNTLVTQNAMKSIIRGQRTQHHELSRGAVGCYLSHFGVWNKIIVDSDKLDNIIIFEDDTKPSLNKIQLDSVLSSCPDDWDIILFGGQFNIDPNFVNDNFNKVDKFYCLHAYMINKKAIEKISKHLFPISMQIDSVLSKIIKLENLNIYAIRNSEWYQNIDVGKTDIQTPIVLN